MAQQSGPLAVVFGGGAARGHLLRTAAASTCPVLSPGVSGKAVSGRSCLGCCEGPGPGVWVLVDGEPPGPGVAQLHQCPWALQRGAVSRLFLSSGMGMWTEVSEVPSPSSHSVMGSPGPPRSQGSCLGQGPRSRPCRACGHPRGLGLGRVYTSGAQESMTAEGGLRWPRGRPILVLL